MNKLTIETALHTAIDNNPHEFLMDTDSLRFEVLRINAVTNQCTVSKFNAGYINANHQQIYKPERPNYLSGQAIWRQEDWLNLFVGPDIEPILDHDYIVLPNGNGGIDYQTARRKGQEWVRDNIKFLMVIIKTAFNNWAIYPDIDKLPVLNTSEFRANKYLLRESIARKTTKALISYVPAYAILKLPNGDCKPLYDLAKLNKLISSNED